MYDEPRLSDTEPLLADAGFEPVGRPDHRLDHVALLAATLDADPRRARPWSAPASVALGVLPPDGRRPPTSAPTAILRRRPEMADFPQRMFGAGRVHVLAPLAIGERAERGERVKSAER